MNECSGPECTHPSHDEIKTLIEKTGGDVAASEEIQEKVESMVRDGQLPPIVTLTDPRAEVLAIVSRPCSVPPSADDIRASSHMIDIMEELGDNAVALAAPQIAIPRRFFVMRMNDGECRSFFNPVIKERSKEKSKKIEGCLSVTGASVKIERPRSVRLQYIDISGELQEEEFTGLHARAICHEVDHLDGRIIMEHMAKEAEHLSKIKGIKKTEKDRRTRRRRAKNKRARLSKRRNRG